MSIQSSSTGGASPDFYLPDEILSVIPTDPYEQLDLARKITSMAIASRVSKLESEVGRLRQKLHEKDQTVAELEDKVAQFQQGYQEAELRLKMTQDENMKLAKERDSLVLNAKKLSRDLAKLETFKRHLVLSLTDENASQPESVDIVTYDQSAPKAYAAYPIKDEEANSYGTKHSFPVKSGTANNAIDASKQAGSKFSLTPYLSPRLTPTATPRLESTNVSPGRYSAARSPQRTSSTTSPTKSHYDYRGGSLSSWYPSSQQSSAANSPPRGGRTTLPARTPRIDGKEFFRQARSRLSYEQFSAFLANIKELNAQKQSREETLKKAEEIFGMDNRDLYLSFQGLLSRNVQ